jgi:hypothetical protein
MDMIEGRLISNCLYLEEEEKNRAVQKWKRGASP